MSNLIRPNPREVLKTSKTVAIIGCSANPYRTSNYAAKYLMNRGYTVIPVNPVEKEILGERCFPKLADVPESVHIDIVNVFRNKRYTEGVLEDGSSRLDKTLWFGRNWMFLRPKQSWLLKTPRFHTSETYASWLSWTVCNSK